MDAVRPIEEVRAEIDRVDDQMRQLLMHRMDLSQEVARIKENAGGRIIIYREDREQEILDRLAEELPTDRRPVCLPVTRKIMECSRMLQYGWIFDRHPELFDTVQTHVHPGLPENRVCFRLTRSNRLHSMSVILGMIGDYGFQMDAMDLLEETDRQVIFEMKVVGSLSDTNMKKMLYQISMECRDFVLYV